VTLLRRKPGADSRTVAVPLAVEIPSAYADPDNANMSRQANHPAHSLILFMTRQNPRPPSSADSVRPQ
jgi:hypothetical protein